MKCYVGVTDGDWFNLLSAQPHLDEVNFWQPGGTRRFRALDPGDLFLFKLHSPRNFIVGGGIYWYSTLLPVSFAWDSFQLANGARSLEEMRTRVGKYRRQIPDRLEDYSVGCILLQQPFFLPEFQWIPVPDDWKANIVQGRRYDLLESRGGQHIWSTIQKLVPGAFAEGALVTWREPPPPGPLPSTERFGKPTWIATRLGQGTFRVLVADAYDRRCAVTRERTLPALEAAHIRPYADGGQHRVDNGLLLRRDLHALFDRGYLTITPDSRLAVSERIREEFENGRDYYALRDQEVWAPPNVDLRVTAASRVAQRSSFPSLRSETTPTSGRLGNHLTARPA